MRVAIAGAGAVGGLFGALLARAGHDVVMIARGATLDALRERGLRVSGEVGDFSIDDVAAVDDPAAIGVVDLVLVAVKAWQVADLAPRLAPLVGAHTLVIPVQNGVEAPRRLDEVLGGGHVPGATCRVVCRAPSPGVIEHVGVHPTIVAGPLRPGAEPAAWREIATVLDEAGIAVAPSDEVRVEMWTKLVFINAASCLGAVTGMTIGRMRAEPETRDLLRTLMAETRDVALAHDVLLPADVVDATLAFTDTLPDDATTSTQRDLLDGRPSELEDLTGAVVHLGAAAGVATPANAVLLACLRPLERAARAGP